MKSGRGLGPPFFQRKISVRAGMNRAMTESSQSLLRLLQMLRPNLLYQKGKPCDAIAPTG